MILDWQNQGCKVGELETQIGATKMTFNPKPLTLGVHQRADDSYFNVYWDDYSEGVKAGYYWCPCDEDGEWLQGEWIDGPYATIEAAAENGWYNEIL